MLRGHSRRRPAVVAAIAMQLLLAATIFAEGAGSGSRRFVGEYRLPSGRLLVVAEGDMEPRSIGSYSVRIYSDLRAGHYLVGMIRPRAGFIRNVTVASSGGTSTETDEFTVLLETAGSGKYTTSDTFICSKKEIVLKSTGRGPTVP